MCSRVVSLCSVLRATAAQPRAASSRPAWHLTPHNPIPTTIERDAGCVQACYVTGLYAVSDKGAVRHLPHCRAETSMCAPLCSQSSSQRSLQHRTQTRTQVRCGPPRIPHRRPAARRIVTSRQFHQESAGQRRPRGPWQSGMLPTSVATYTNSRNPHS